MLLFLGAAGALFSAAVVDLSSRWPILLAIPLLAVAAAYVVTQHNDIIGAIASYCEAELTQWLAGTLPEPPPQWDGSRALAGLRNRAFANRLVAHLTFFSVPAALATVVALVGATHSGMSTALELAIGVAGSAAALWSGWLFVRSYRFRREARFGGSDRSTVPGASVKR